jgi:hypothetical protein
MIIIGLRQDRRRTSDLLRAALNSRLMAEERADPVAVMLLVNETELSIFFHPRRVRCLFLSSCLAGFVMTGSPAPAAERAEGTGKAAPIAFDVAPQPLEAALDAFSSTSNVQVLYETSLTSGRRSASVQGILTPEAALNAMLAGTGLTAWHTTKDSYSLVPQDAASLSGDDIGRPLPEIARYGHFLGVVQAGFLDALCRSPETRPGRYKIALKFMIGASGGVLQTSLLSSTGDRGRDAEIVAAVEHLMLGEAPPPELSQPITMVIAPRSPDVTGDCASADRMRASR